MRRRPRKGRPEERSPNRNGSTVGAPPGAGDSDLDQPPRRGERKGNGTRTRPGSKIVRLGAMSSSSPAEVVQRLKPLGSPKRVRVVTDPTGAPLRVSSGRGWRSVLTVRERWRIDDEWWRDTLSREYFDVVLTDGRVVELYRDLEKDTWYAHGGGSAFSDR